MVWWFSIKPALEPDRWCPRAVQRMENQLKEQRERRIFMTARYAANPMPDVMRLYKRRIEDIVAGDATWAEKRGQMAEAHKNLLGAVARARFARDMFTPMAERSEREQRVDAEMARVNAKALAVNQEVEKHMRHRLEMETDWRREIRFGWKIYGIR